MQQGPASVLTLSLGTCLRLQGSSGPFDLLQDFICGGCPDKGFRSIVVVSHVAVDGDLKIENTLEDTSADALSGDLTEEALDEIEPGGRSWGEV